VLESYGLIHYSEERKVVRTKDVVYVEPDKKTAGTMNGHTMWEEVAVDIHATVC
jgi:hypothetical protein